MICTQAGAVQDIEYYYGMDNKFARMDGRDWPDMGVQITDTYRGDGKRLSRNHHTDAYGWNGTTTSYFYGAGFDVASAWVGTDRRTYIGSLAEANGTTSSIGAFRYYTHDHLGSTRAAYSDNATPTLQAEFDYSPYGDPIFAQDANFNTALGPVAKRFTGHLYDTKANVYQTPFRTYSPTTARWLQQDPLGMVDGPNMYQYALSNPIKFVDVLGLDVVYLLDQQGARGAGHAALLVGDDKNGWGYYSFGFGRSIFSLAPFTNKDNLEYQPYQSFKAAASSKELARYDKYIRFGTDWEADRAARQAMRRYLDQDYNLFTRNCDDAAAEAIRAAGIDFKDKWKPNSTFIENYYNPSGESGSIPPSVVKRP